MKGSICILAMLFLCGSVAATDTEVEFHVLTTNSTIYVWYGSNAPINCGSGSTASCDIVITTPNATCNDSWSVLGNISTLQTHVTAINASLSGLITSSTSDNLKTAQAVTMLDQLKGEIILNLGTTTSTTLAPFLKTEQEVTDCRINLTKAEGSINSLNIENGNMQQSLTSCQNSKNDLTNYFIVLIAVFAYFVLRPYGILPGSKKSIRSPPAIGRME